MTSSSYWLHEEYGFTTEDGVILRISPQVKEKLKVYQESACKKHKCHVSFNSCLGLLLDAEDRRIAIEKRLEKIRSDTYI